MLNSTHPGLREETRTTIWYGRSRFQTFVVLTSRSCRRPEVLFLLSSSSSWRHASLSWRRAPVFVLTSRSYRRPDVLFLPTSWRLVPADILTSCSCRHPHFVFLPSSSTSWRHASMSWCRAPVVDFIVLTSRVAVLTSRSCRHLRRPGVTRRRSNVALLACFLFLPSSLTFFRRRRSDILPTSTRRRRVRSLLSALVMLSSFVWRICADSRYS